METIFGFIKQQENSYRQPIPINDKWDWSMKDTIQTAELYKNSQLLTGKSDYKPMKNITRPILNLQYRAEGFDLKDIQLFIDDSEEYYKSFLVRKYHEMWALKNQINTFISDVVESYVDFGAALVKDVYDVKPEVVPLQSIAFCDQTDMLSGPIGIRHFFSPDQLLKMARVGWGDTKNGATETLANTILLSREEKKNDSTQRITKTPGKYIEIFEVHGNVPKTFANPEDDSGEYETRLFIVCFYQKKNRDEQEGIILYTAIETESPFKLLKRDKVFGRALGMGGAEELFDPQVWINYDMIRKQGMLDAASKTILQSDDPTVAQKNRVRNMENLEILDVAPGTSVRPVDTFPRNTALFDNSTMEWENHAQQLGAANDAISGKAPVSGTSGKLQEMVVAEGHSLHEYRRGKIAIFIEEIYRDWIIPNIQNEITKGTTFLAELDLKEVQYIADALVTCETNDMIIQKVLAGELVSQEAVAGYQQLVRSEFKKKGNKHFIEILKGEFKDSPISVRANVAGKQKDLAGKYDKLMAAFRMMTSNPYILQSPPVAELFNEMNEAMGLNPIDLTDFHIPRIPQMRITERMDYKDLQPEAQQQMVDLMGYAGAAKQPSEANPTASTNSSTP